MYCWSLAILYWVYKDEWLWLSANCFSIWNKEFLISLFLNKEFSNIANILNVKEQKFCALGTQWFGFLDQGIYVRIYARVLYSKLCVFWSWLFTGLPFSKRKCISTLDILLSQLQTLDFFQLFSLSNSGFVFIVEWFSELQKHGWAYLILQTRLG